VKYTLAISAAAHLLFIATIIVPAYQGRNADTSQIISVSLLGGGATTVTAAAPQATAPGAPAERVAKEPEPAKSKMAYKAPPKEKKPKPGTDRSKAKASTSQKTSAGQKTSGGSGAKGAGTGSGGGPGGGGNITVDNQDFRFAYYLEVLRERISYNWSPPPVFGSAAEVTATVYFKISRNGTISDEKIERTSKHEIFDRAAVRAVKISDPLPPLPAGFKGKWLGVHFEFQHSSG
jgi:TonB family protein